MGRSLKQQHTRSAALLPRLVNIVSSCVFLVYIFVPLNHLDLLVSTTEPSSSSWTTTGSKHAPQPVHIIHSQVLSLQGLSTHTTTTTRQEFCTVWDINVDSWWSNLPDWEIVLENETHQCFRPMQLMDSSKSAFLTRLHAIQHSNASCQQQQEKEVFYKKITGSGWGVDMSHVIDGLRYALEHEQPVHLVTPTDWQYAVGKKPDLQTPICSATEYLDCYFLPLTSCQKDASLVAWTRQQGDIAYQFPWHGFDKPSSNEWLLQYATRPQTWLRKRAFDIAQKTGLLSTSLSCLAIHVRRNDIVLHGKFSRKYHRISEYLDAAIQQGWHFQNILLLTDDANAIEEATKLHPQYHWFYVERERHRASEGGWENHIPSHDPALEVAILHANFLLLKHCSAIVHSKSNLADYFYGVMRQANENVFRINIDQSKQHAQIHNEKNIKSVKISRDIW